MTLPRKARTWQILNQRDLVLAVTLVDIGYDDDRVARWMRGVRRYLASEKIETIRLAITSAMKTTSRPKPSTLH